MGGHAVLYARGEVLLPVPAARLNPEPMPA